MKAKFKVGDRVIVENPDKYSVPYGTAYHVITKVDKFFTGCRYRVAPVISNWYKNKVYRKPWDDQDFYLKRFKGLGHTWETEYIFVGDKQLRRYLKKDMDILYQVIVNGDTMYEGGDKKQVKGWKSNTLWVDITIIETDLNTYDEVKRWSNKI